MKHALTLTAFLFALPLAFGQGEFKLLPSDGSSDDHFGKSVAVSGTTAIVGAHYDGPMGFQSGSAYLFDTTTGTEIAKLLPSNGSSDDEFGTSVAISGTTAIVGAPFNNQWPGGGLAYLFDASTGTEIAILQPSDGSNGDYFGISVAISGTTAIVGAYRDESEVNGAPYGSAYLFDTTTGTEITKLLPSNGSSEGEFGISVAISGGTAIVGAHFDNYNGEYSGSAYLFDTTTGNQIATLAPSDSHEGARFGVSVGISGTTAIVGAHYDGPMGSRSGSAYLFDTTTGNQIAKLFASDGAPNDYFGRSVAISGTIAIVGAYGHYAGNGSGYGSAYLFDTTTGDEIAKFIANDSAQGDSFGYSVAIGAVAAIVGNHLDDDNGTNSGSAYLYNGGDCNANGVGDWQDIFDGTSLDFNRNHIPDECEPDCNGNGFPDFLDILYGLSTDCDGNDVPDECDLANGTSQDCNGNGIPDICETDCNGNGIDDACDLADGTSFDCNGNGILDECDIASGFSLDMNEDGQPDECKTDCNGNGVPDYLDILYGLSVDCDGNGIPDECETDCNGNGIVDSCDIASGFEQDCDGNGVPDSCESIEDCDQNGTADACDVVDGTSPDCNGNGVPDSCDIADGTSPDCNGNGVPDSCDLLAGTSLDCNLNAVPDECEPDCNANGFPDDCDITAGTSLDCNANGAPDECDISSGLEGDCDGDWVPDACQIAANPNLDLNQNGILDTCECNVASTCQTAPNSAGPGAEITYTGSVFISFNDLTLVSISCPPSQFGIFFYGPNATQIPLMDGYLCVGGQINRLGPTLTGPTGVGSWALDYTSPPRPSGQISAGSTWYFQFWYRDPAGPGGTGSNLTNGLEVTFCP